MKYRYSHLDKRNMDWFSKDVTRATLTSISLRRGQLRGLTSRCDFSFQYPITVVAGQNGSGKSTLLALAACSYHNRTDGFSLPGRKTPYYTMSDFFVQSAEEVSPDGISIWYEFLHNNWRKTRRCPDGIGRLWQAHKKERGGKWSNYSRRISRNVVFFGIERVVPHSERSVSKSYRHAFKRAASHGFEADVIAIVSRILGKKYDDFWFREHSKYRLPHVKTHKSVYSGFNMGAGENALFEIMSTILAAPEGLFVVVDEIELGLHESAQKRFISELKKLCNARKLQVVCTTHSPTILACVPPEGRFFLERHGPQTFVINGITPEYAAGRLAEQNSRELDVFVEDGVARQLVQSVLTTNERRRVNLLPIGSAAAIVRQLSARYKAGASGECIALLDGDQRAHAPKHRRYFLGLCEAANDDTDATEWMDDRLSFLPGDSWPEWWILTAVNAYELEDLADSLGVSEGELSELIETAVSAGKHKEFASLADQLCLPTDEVCGVICKWIAVAEPESFVDVKECIVSHLD